MIFNLKKFSNRIAVIDNDIKYKYKDIIKDIDSFDLKNQEKSLFFLLADNSYETLVAYLYCIKLKISVVLIDKKISREFLKKYIDLYKPKFIFCSKNYNFYSENFKKYSTFKNSILFSSLKKRNYEIYEGLFLLLPTSGSTGDPKFVRLSYSNIIHNTKSIIKYLSINKDHNTITTLPFNYSYGLSVINSHLLVGSKIVFNNHSILEKKFWIDFKKYKVTSFAGVPFSYKLLIKLKKNYLNSKHFKYSTIAGGSLNNSDLKFLVDLYKKNKKKLIVMYGQTEASPRISYVPWSKIQKKTGSIGKPISGGSLKINLFNSSNNAQTKTGEIIYCGPNVCLGYANNYKDLKKDDENKGILRTGDIGYLDSDGFAYITGRLKRISKINGIRVNLDSIENQLSQKGIKCCLVTKKNNLFFFITSKIYEKKIKFELIKKMNFNPANLKTKVIEDFPLNSNGKINYTKLLKIIK